MIGDGGFWKNMTKAFASMIVVMGSSGQMFRPKNTIPRKGIIN